MNDFHYELLLRWYVNQRDIKKLNTLLYKVLKSKSSDYCDDTLELLASFFHPKQPHLAISFCERGRPQSWAERWRRAVALHHHRKVSGLPYKQALYEAQLTLSKAGDNVGPSAIEHAYVEFREEIESQDHARSVILRMQGAEPSETPYTTQHLLDPIAWIMVDASRNPTKFGEEDE